MPSAYLWLAPVVAGRDVLDVGCGTAAGAALLAAAGAARVAGVDPARAQVEAAGAPDGVELAQAPLDALPYEDAAFDVVVVLDVLDAADDPAPVLGEALRVLRPGGVAVVSAAPGDRAVAAALEDRCGAVARFERHDLAADAFVGARGAALADARIEPAPGGLGAPDQVVLVAGASVDGAVVVAGEDRGARRLAQRWAEQREEVAGWRERVQAADRDREQLLELRRQLEAAELALAPLPEVRADRDALRGELEVAEHQLAQLRAEVAELKDVRASLERASQALEDVTGSASWKLTRPLRRAMALLR